MKPDGSALPGGCRPVGPEGRDLPEAESMVDCRARPPARSPVLLVVGAGVFLVAHVAAAIQGGGAWGLHHLRYLPEPAILAAVAASVAVAAVVHAGWRRIPPFVGGLVALPTFWILRDRGHWLGDGIGILDGVGRPIEYLEREPLSALLNQMVLNETPRLGLAPTSGLELLSCLLGAALVMILLRLDADLDGGGAVFALAFFTGTAQLFFGYVEVYPSVVLAVAAFLVAARQPAGRAASLLPCLLLFALALFLHISSVTLLPALGFLVFRQLHLRRSGTARLRLVGEIAVAGAAAWGFWELAFARVPGAGSPIEFLSILGDASRYSYTGVAVRSPGLAPPFWSTQHVGEWLNLQLLLVPLTLPVALVVVARRPRALLSNGWAVFLAIAAVSYLAAQFNFFPYLGAPRDWDALAAGALPVSLLAGALLPRLRADRALLAALAVFHTVPWILVNAIPASAKARFVEIPMPSGQASFVLGVHAMKTGHLEEAIERLTDVVEEVPEATPSWFALGTVLERAGRPEEARDAYLRVLFLFEKDARVPRGEVLERLGMIDWRAGRREHARVAFEEALREQPESGVARMMLSYAELDAGRPDRVLDLLAPLLDRPHKDPSILLLRARALAKLGRDNEAAAVLREAAQRFPDDASVRSALREFAERP